MNVTNKRYTNNEQVLYKWTKWTGFIQVNEVNRF